MNHHPDRARRRALLALLGAGTGLAGAVQLALAQGTPAQGVRRLRGEVTINGNPAAMGDVVRAGDTVTTGRTSIALLVIDRDAFLLRDASSVEFSGQGTAVDLLRLVTGKLLGAFASGRDRRIVTPTSTIGIRGTAAYLEAQEERTYFCLCYGTADVAAANSNARASYATTHHESPRYVYGDGRREAIVPAAVRNHTDAEVALLETLVGRTPPPEFTDDPNTRY